MTLLCYENGTQGTEAAGVLELDGVETQIQEPADPWQLFSCLPVAIGLLLRTLGGNRPHGCFYEIILRSDGLMLVSPDLVTDCLDLPSAASFPRQSLPHQPALSIAFPSFCLSLLSSLSVLL